MRRSGEVTLWLSQGAVPHFREMVELSREIVRALCEVLGSDEAVRRFADPFWVSCFATVLGFEWNTSGQTTVPMKALKIGLTGTDIPVRVLGGKGRGMTMANLEAASVLSEIGVDEVGEIRRVMRITTAVDDVALQDSYDVYFHATIVSESGKWSVINQGMNVETQTARRYHWSSERGAEVEEPHTEILSNSVENVVLDLTSKSSSETRSTILEMLSDTPPSRLNEDLAQAKAILKRQTFLDREYSYPLTQVPRHLLPPQKLDDDCIRRAKNLTKFEELLMIPGMGPATLRGLAYIASLVYGSRLSWKDPVKFGYAFGTKSGKPYYVNKLAMKEAADVLRRVVFAAQASEGDKILMLRRLASLMEQLFATEPENH